MMKFKIILITLLGLFVASSCTNKNRFKIDTADSLKELHVIRFDSLLLTADTANLTATLKVLYSRYPEFTSYFASQLMGVNPSDTAEVLRLLKLFRSTKDFDQVNADVQQTFSNTDSIEAQISEAYSYMQHYFPQLKTPPVYFFVSGFNRSIILEDNFVGVGLDLYLGNNYPKYKEISYEYLLYNMRPASIAPDLISALLFKHFRFDGKQERLLENMLYRGKVMYLLQVTMPQLTPNDLIGYSKLQWEWCRKYEDKIWNTLVGQKDLYSTDQLLINKYLNDAPFTAPISQESPGRLGTWVGWQIVQSYMNSHTDVSLQKLIATTDYQVLLNQSEYNP